MAKQEKYSFDQVMTDLRKKQYHAAYMLMGEEPYYIDMISDFIQTNIIDESARDFDQTILYGKDIDDVRMVINAAKRFPMMGTHQVVVVREAQLVKNWDDLAIYLKNPQTSTILVLCYKYGTPDKRKKWFQEMAASGVVFESQKLRDYEMGRWIQEYVRTKNMGIDEKGTIMLTEFLGTDLSKVAHEIDKLMITKPQGVNLITPDLIEKNIGISKDYNVFELQNALINRDVLKANRIARYFDQNRKSNPMVLVLSNLFKFFSDLMMYHYIADKSQAARELGINPYFVKDFQKASQVFGAWKTMNIISYIRETDARYKGIDNVSAEEGELLKELIFKILH